MKPSFLSQGKKKAAAAPAYDAAPMQPMGAPAPPFGKKKAKAKKKSRGK